MATPTPSLPALEQQLSRLRQLDQEAEAAYEAAAVRVRRPALRRGLRALAADCRRHVDELAPYLPAAGVSRGPADDERRLLRAGRLMLAQVLGDAAVLDALGDLVRQSTAAYADALADDRLAVPARAVVQRNACDERRHEHWLRAALRARAAAKRAGAGSTVHPPGEVPAWENVGGANSANTDLDLASRGTLPHT